MWQPCEVEVLVAAQEEFSIDIQACQFTWGIPAYVAEMINLKTRISASLNVNR